MAINLKKLLSTSIAGGRQAYDEADTGLYALALGLCRDPLEAAELAFVMGPEAPVLPTFACVLAHPGHWMSDPTTGIDYRQVLHVSQRLECHHPLAARGEVTSRSRVRDVFDKGLGKGALIMAERTLHDEAGTLVATLVNGSLCRADGGFGGPPGGPGRPAPPPARPADASFEMPSSPRAALLYRLLGDRNPLHADPKAARQAGFERPILHGLATFGIAGYALVRLYCDGDPARLAGMECSFAAPAYPGETFRTEFWEEPDNIRFETRVVERDRVVLAGGFASLR